MPISMHSSMPIIWDIDIHILMDNNYAHYHVYYYAYDYAYYYAYGDASLLHLMVHRMMHCVAYYDHCWCYDHNNMQNMIIIICRFCTLF